MQYVFVNGRLAVIVKYWEQPGKVIEGGARVELRRVKEIPDPHTILGTAGLAVEPLNYGGLWRADLFMVLSEAGKSCFHFHPKFENHDVGMRHEDDELTANPRRWIAHQLNELPALLANAGGADLLASIDLEDHRQAMPLILAAIDSCLAQLPIALARSLNASVS